MTGLLLLPTTRLPRTLSTLRNDALFGTLPTRHALKVFPVPGSPRCYIPSANDTPPLTASKPTSPPAHQPPSRHSNYPSRGKQATKVPRSSSYPKLTVCRTPPYLHNAVSPTGLTEHLAWTRTSTKPARTGPTSHYPSR